MTCQRDNTNWPWRGAIYITIDWLIDWLMHMRIIKWKNNFKAQQLRWRIQCETKSTILAQFFKLQQHNQEKFQRFPFFQWMSSPKIHKICWKVEKLFIELVKLPPDRNKFRCTNNTPVIWTSDQEHANQS
jgi:hypothetical protein